MERGKQTNREKKKREKKRRRMDDAIKSFVCLNLEATFSIRFLSSLSPCMQLLPTFFPFFPFSFFFLRASSVKLGCTKLDF